MNGNTILCIEDDVANRTLVRRVLEAEGYQVIEAEDGYAGLNLIRNRPPDLIIVDINLPDVDGYEVTAQLKKLESMAQVPVVAITANVMKGDRERSLAAGCDGYIQKPIDIDLLPQQIAGFLKGRAHDR